MSPLRPAGVTPSRFTRFAAFSSLLFACGTSSTSPSPTPEAGLPPGVDAATPQDGAAPVDGGTDAGAPRACVPTVAQTTDAGLSCTAPDAGPAPDGGLGDGGIRDVCTPPSVVSFTPRWIAPTGYHQGKCTAAQRTTYRTVCLGTQADGGAACKSFLGTAEGKACEECILPSTGPYLGALTATGGFVAVNVAGCIALLEPCNESCAHDYLATIECEAAACGTCARMAGVTSAELDACESTAAACGCRAYADKSACTELFTGPDHPAAGCMQSTFAAAYDVAAEVFCGP